MKKIYYLDHSIVLAPSHQIDPTEYEILASIDPTKLETFSHSAKPIAIICEDEQPTVEDFFRGFELIYADGGVVKNQVGDTLMIFRNGYWDLPKGKRERGENSAECALREVQEECAIQGLTLEDFRCNTYHIYRLAERYILKKTAWWNMTHSGKGTLTPQTEEGITKVEWVTPQQLPNHLAQSYSTIIDIL